MAIAHRDTFSEVAGTEPVADCKSTIIQKFNGFGAMRAHLDQYASLQAYLRGKSNERPEVPLTCHSNCMVAQWLHGDNKQCCLNRQLLDTVCKRCHEFQEEAAQSLLFASMGKPVEISTDAQSFHKLDSASKLFQTALADLHVECWDS
jgi:hypothetical protein